MAGSTLLIHEYFAAEDERFLAEVLGCDQSAWLKAFGPRWYSDPRPFARRMLHRYLLQGADHDGHRGLVKAVLKAAEPAADDLTLAHLLVAFDRFPLRQLVTRSHYDFASRTSVQRTEPKYLKGLLKRRPSDLKHLAAGRRQVIERNQRFSVVTRRYLQRRAWRYFRKLAWRDAARYRASLSVALKLYPEDALSSPQRLVDAWGLMNALYAGSPALDRQPKGVVVVEGRSLKELVPAPYKPEVWSGCFDELLALFLEAGSNAVRAWALQIIRRDYATSLVGLPMVKVRRLLRHPSNDAQQLGAELLRAVSDLDKLPLDEWLALLRLDNAAALPLVCELLQKHVSPDRLTLAQCLELACSKAAPVAELGLGWARARPVKSEADLDALMALATALVQTVRTAGTEWVASLLLLNEGEGHARRARELLDSAYLDVRRKARWLMSADKRLGQSTLLWAAMAESPWADVREALVATLTERQASLSPESLRGVWASALLAIHRGGRAKRAVAEQLADRLVRVPAEVGSLLPLLGIALRSVRPPERRAALAALSKVALGAPALRSSMSSGLPELKFLSEQAWA